MTLIFDMQQRTGISRVAYCKKCPAIGIPCGQFSDTIFFLKKDLTISWMSSPIPGIPSSDLIGKSIVDMATESHAEKCSNVYKLSMDDNQPRYAIQKDKYIGRYWLVKCYPFYVYGYGLLVSANSFCNEVFKLTARQFAITRLLSCGYGINEIAFTLNISVNTVRTHLQRASTSTGIPQASMQAWASNIRFIFSVNDLHAWA